MHTKSDSEVTSLAASSPPRSPRSRPLYFVQSPSRDSHDEGDSKLSFHSTPILLSPIGSPLHPSGGVRHVGTLSASSRSRDSAHSLLLPHSSRSHKPCSSSTTSRPPKGAKTTHKSSPWAARNVIHEEDYGADSSLSPLIPAHIYSIILVILSCAAFLFLFILLFWLVCRPSHPELSLKNVVFHNFYMGVGTDASGVPTKMISLNCTIQLIYYNPSKYFGVHVNPIAADLFYSELKIAKGQILKYYQQKATRKNIPVVVQAIKVPVYGASAGVPGSYDLKHAIPLSMVATLDSQYYVVGKMVTPRFQNRVSCDIVLSSETMSLLTPLKSSCTYTPTLSSSSHR